MHIYTVSSPLIFFHLLGTNEKIIFYQRKLLFDKKTSRTFCNHNFVYFRLDINDTSSLSYVTRKKRRKNNSNNSQL